MNPESARRAQKRTHSLMNLDLKVNAWELFTIDRENARLRCLDPVRVDFEEVLL